MARETVSGEALKAPPCVRTLIFIQSSSRVVEEVDDVVEVVFKSRKLFIPCRDLSKRVEILSNNLKKLFNLLFVARVCEFVFVGDVRLEIS
jgi:16S rRNA C1402 (ribose-2'-O) methylase RsmI